MSYVKGVSWTTSNGKGRSNEHTKRYPLVYYYDEGGNLRTKRISRLQIPFYKAKICKQVTGYFDVCEKKFTVLVRKKSNPQCPYCLES